MFEIKDKICLVTGGGGSIGSEIVRTLVRLGAKRVIAVDISENGLFELMTDTDSITAEIASIRDRAKIMRLFEKYRPDIIFHAAAHKHVPFMEQCPEEAVKNNIYGTETVVDAAEKYGAEKFLLISTDKAVEPVSVMGASKRICEMMIYEKSKASKTLLSTVRFCNVTNSSGSVIPLFKKQIENGVVTVTDKEVKRYFMPIPRAAQLAVNAADIMRGGEVFVPEVKESVKIYDLAKDMIEKSGKQVQIKFTHLRRGDKLNEKLSYDFEELLPCGIDGMLKTRASGMENLSEMIDRLYDMADACDREGIYRLIMQITG